MALRLCGASNERTLMAQRACWCGGLFCGKGGSVMTRRFRDDWHHPGIVKSRAGFEDIMRQLCLVDRQEVRRSWVDRVDSARVVAAMGEGQEA